MSLETPNNFALYHKHFLKEVILSESCIQKFKVLDANFLPRDWYAIQRRKSIFSVSDVIIDSQTGIMFCGKNNAISIYESAPITYTETSDYLRPKTLKQIEKGEWTVLSSRSYAHWLLEDLPRFLEIMTVDADLRVLVSSRPTGYTRDVLEMLNIKPDLVSPVARVEQAKFISAPTAGSIPTIETLNILKNFAELASSFAPRQDIKSRIYISRRGSSRSPHLEKHIEGLMKKHNIHVVRLEQMRLWEQIRLFQNANLIIGPHGAGLFNFVWSNQKPTVIELYNNSFLQDSVRTMASYHGIRCLRVADSSLKYIESRLLDIL